MYITTEYDYELQTEVFKVNGDKGYTHDTATILNEVYEQVDDEYVPKRDKSKIDYFVSDFTVDVNNDLSESNVVLYDNGEPISFFLNDNAEKLLPWSLNSNKTTIQLHLGYAVEHKIYARYMGNKKALPSKSQTITIYEDIPTLYASNIIRTTDTVQFAKNTTFTIPFQYQTNRELETDDSKDIELWIDGEKNTEVTVTLLAETTSIDGTLTVDDGLDAGLHKLEIRFAGDNHNESFTLKFDISVGYKLLITDHSQVISVTDEIGAGITVPLPYTRANHILCKTLDYFDNNYAGNDYVKVYDSNNVLMGEIHMSDGEGDVSFTETPTSGEFYAKTTLNSQDYISESIELPVIKVKDTVFDAEDVIAINYLGTNTVTIANYQWLFNPATNLKGIPVAFYDIEEIDPLHPQHYVAKFGYTDEDGVATIPYTGKGDGEKLIYTKCGYSARKEQLVDDVTQFWNTDPPSINKEYKILSDTTFYELNAGFKFQNQSANSLCIVGFGDGKQYNGKWEIVFDVISVSKGIRLVFSQWYINNGGDKVLVPVYTTPLLDMKAGAITIKNDKEGTVSLWYPSTKGTPVNGSSQFLKYTKQINFEFDENFIGKPVIGMTSPTAKSQLTFNNLRYREY